MAFFQRTYTWKLNEFMPLFVMTRIPLHIKFSNLNVVWAWKNPLKIDVLKGVKNRLATITIVQDSNKQQGILVWAAESSVENLFPHRFASLRSLSAAPLAFWQKCHSKYGVTYQHVNILHFDDGLEFDPNWAAAAAIFQLF